MTVSGPKLLAVGALVLLTPLLLFAERPTDHHKRGCDTAFRGQDKNCQQVPEGGSNAGYLLALGATCLGAMLVRSRLRSSEQ